jgi:hypothetical protein
MLIANFFGICPLKNTVKWHHQTNFARGLSLKQSPKPENRSGLLHFWSRYLVKLCSRRLWIQRLPEPEFHVLCIFRRLPDFFWGGWNKVNLEGFAFLKQVFFRCDLVRLCWFLWIHRFPGFIANHAHKFSVPYLLLVWRRNRNKLLSLYISNLACRWGDLSECSPLESTDLLLLPHFYRKKKTLLSRLFLRFAMSREHADRKGPAELGPRCAAMFSDGAAQNQAKLSDKI